MPVSEVELTGSLSPVRLSMAAAEVVRLLDRGHVVHVLVAGDPSSGSLYVERKDGELHFSSASMWPPTWRSRLERILTNMEDS